MLLVANFSLYEQVSYILIGSSRPSLKQWKEVGGREIEKETWKMSVILPASFVG